MEFMMEIDAATMKDGKLVCLIVSYITAVELLHFQTLDLMQILKIATSLVSHTRLAITVAILLIHPTQPLLPLLMVTKSTILVSMTTLHKTLLMILALIGTMNNIHNIVDNLIMINSQLQSNVVHAEGGLCLIKLPIKKLHVSMTILLEIVLETPAHIIMI
jgi:hypothetical protein